MIKPISIGTPTLAATIQLPQAILMEAIMAFFLVSAVFGTIINPDLRGSAGSAIGLTLLFCVLVGGPLTGAAVNPARAFGPALVSGQWVAHIAYWVGPMLGGIVAALVWEHFLLPPEAECGDRAISSAPQRSARARLPERQRSSPSRIAAVTM